jgi:hypothetical protein
MSSPVGFWSYARSDDAHSDGHLSQLRTIVGKAIALQYGADVTIWQDIQAIPPGADWAASIERTIGQTVFFMPIVTPRYLKSTNCLAEFQSFRHRMQELGRDDLIFPILYVGVDQITADDTAFGPELDALRRHQWIDFRPLRHADCRSHEVWTWVDGLAENILNVAVPVSKAERAAHGQAGASATDESRLREAEKATERARQQEAAARAAEKARQQEAVEKERQRQAAARAAEQARQREAAQTPLEQPSRPEVIDPYPEIISSVDSSGTAVVASYAGRHPATPVPQRRIGMLAISAGGLVVVAGAMVAVFLRHEPPQTPTVVPASTPMIVAPASAVTPPASAVVTPPAPPSPAASNSATAQTKAPDLEGSVDQILDSAGFIVSGKIVNLYAIRGEDGRPARAMQRYLQSEGNMVRCFAHDEAYQCFANGHDIAVHAVRLGWARTRQGAPPQYAAAEDEARRARVGVWSK